VIALRIAPRIALRIPKGTPHPSIQMVAAPGHSAGLELPTYLAPNPLRDAQRGGLRLLLGLASPLRPLRPFGLYRPPRAGVPRGQGAKGGRAQGASPRQGHG